MSAIARSRMVASSSRSASAVAANRLSTVSRHFASSSMAGWSSHSKIPVVEEPVIYKSDSYTRIYQLNRHKQLNALNHEMITSLTSKLTSWKDSELCRVIIGVGTPKAFCAGGDVKQLVLELKEHDALKEAALKEYASREDARKEGELTEISLKEDELKEQESQEEEWRRLEEKKSTALAFFKDEFQLNWLMARLGKPYISVMDGITMGGGCGLALPAAIRIATSKSHFAMPETKIGYAPDVGVNYYLAQLDGYIGAWLAITGQDVYGRAVYELGLATHYVEPDALQLLIGEVAQLSNPTITSISSIISASTPSTPSASSINSKSNPDGTSVIKGEIREFLDKTFRSKSVKEIYEKLQSAESNQVLSEEVRAWAKEQREYMDARSPTGMAVALEGYRRARSVKRLDVTLKNDMSMATGFSGSNRATEDFITGVTAVLIDRTKERPAWSPSSITDESLLPENILTNFFDAKSPSQSDRPTLELNPPSTSNISSGPDTTWGRFRKYGLPSEKEVEAQVSGSAPGSGAFKITRDELIERVLDVRGESGGARAAEVEQWTRGIVDRICDVKENGYLDLKKEKSKA